MPIEASDPDYGSPYMAAFLGTHVQKIETIQAHETGRAGMRRNERGLRITNDRNMEMSIGWNIHRPNLEHGIVMAAPDQMDDKPGLFSFSSISG
ncbi:hypothetical protein [Labrys monachus]|uniref:Uncharacterized protein n=1 Tax=Labrys monachus TaxID=217067 RepID=A0ABU0FLL9_9HYPH|nr:hypothetical protein [Labrys monachus]MDQ0395406.1 hypothetical protein [Labrys monachus]